MGRDHSSAHREEQCEPPANRPLGALRDRTNTDGLTDEFESEVFVGSGLFGVFVEKHDGSSDPAVLQRLLTHAGQLRGGKSQSDAELRLPGRPLTPLLTSCRIRRSSSLILRAGSDLSGRGLIHSLMADITPLSMKVSFKSCLRDKQHHQKLQQAGHKSQVKGVRPFLSECKIKVSIKIRLHKLQKLFESGPGPGQVR